MRDHFFKLALLDHLANRAPTRSPYDLAESISDAWQTVRSNPKHYKCDLSVASVIRFAKLIAPDQNDNNLFSKVQDWGHFVTECGTPAEDPHHVTQWIFSELYWHHLPYFPLSTAWLYTANLAAALKVRAPILTDSNIAAFMTALSGSGPPSYDGQTLYFSDFS